MNNRLINKLMVALPTAIIISAFSSTSDVKAYTMDGDDDWGMVSMESFEKYYTDSKTTLGNIRDADKDGEKRRKELIRKLDELKTLATVQKDKYVKLTQGKKKDPIEMNKEATDTLTHVTAIIDAKSTAMTRAAFDHISSITVDE